MTEIVRLSRDHCVKLLDELAVKASGRPAVVNGLMAVRDVVAAQAEDATEFPLQESAQAAAPFSSNPVTAFRDFRHTVTEIAGNGVAFKVDTRKRTKPEDRRWWVEAPDPTGDELRKLSAANAGPDPGVVPVRGRRALDGKTVVKTYFDIAPKDRSATAAFLRDLQGLLEADKDYVFELIPSPAAGSNQDEARRNAIAEAHLVVSFVSPAYLKWDGQSTRSGSRVLRGGREVPVCWEPVSSRLDRGRFAATRLFSAEPTAAEAVHAVDADEVGLAKLREPRRGRELVRLHQTLADVLGTPSPEPVHGLALKLARVDEPNPVPARALRTELDKVAVAASATPAPSVDVVDHMVQWATHPDGRPYLVLFGEYGMGKTIAAQTFTRRLLERRESDPSVPLPIYFDLRNLSSELRRRDAGLDELLDDLIARAWHAGATDSLVKAHHVVHQVQQRGAVIVFDGLDEVLVHMTQLQGQQLLRELFRVLPPNMVATATATGEPGQRLGRIVFTCRTHFFRTIREQHNFFRAEDRDRIAEHRYEALHLLPFDETQVRLYLETRHGGGSVDKALDVIRSVHNLMDLASRPYTLQLVVSQIERLERRIVQNESIDAAALYEELVESWLDRDEGKHQLARDHKVRLMEDLAARLWRQGGRRISVTDLENWLNQRLVEDQALHAWFQLAGKDPGVLAEDLRTATFIVRPGSDDFEFAHTSLLEYFLARFLYRAMTDGRVDDWALPDVSMETLDFLVEIVASGDGDCFTAGIASCRDAYRPLVSELVVHYALRAASRQARVPSLARFDLRGARLRGVEVNGAVVNLKGANLAGADLREARLHNVRLDGADLTGAQLVRAELMECSLRSARLTAAALDGAIVRRSDIEGVELTDATGEDSQWLSCDGRPVPDLPQASLTTPAAKPKYQRGSASLEMLAGVAGFVSAVAWSPDGTLLASADRGGVAIWNPRSRVQRVRLRWGELSALAWSPDGEWLASGGRDGRVLLWHPADLTGPAAELRGHDDWVRTVAWSPDGTRLASSGDDGRVLLWNPADAAEPPTELPGPQNWVCALAWSPDGTRLASSGDDGRVLLWDPAGATIPLVELVGHHWADALAWSPDGAQLASGDIDGRVLLWDPANPDAPPTRLPSGDFWSALAWSPDGTLLAWGGDRTVYVWDGVGTTTLPGELPGLRGGVQTLAWSPDGSCLACVDEDGGVLLWSPGDSAASLTGMAVREEPVFALAWSADGSTLASGGDDGPVKLWDIGDPAVPPTELPRVDDDVRALAWSSNRSRLACGGATDGRVVLWDLGDHSAPAAELGSHDYWVRSLAWSPDGSRLASGDVDGVVLLWDAANVEASPTRCRGQGQWTGALAWSPDGSKLASAGDDGDVRLWDPADPAARPAELPGHEDWVRAVAWSPDGSRLASCGDDGRVLLWDAADLQRPPLALARHSGWVYALAWSPDGSRLAWGGDDGRVRLCDPAHPGAEPAQLPSAFWRLQTIAWSPDGQRLAVGGDGGFQIISLATGEVELTVFTFKGGAWCVVAPGDRILQAHGEVWRWLRWRKKGRLSKADKRQPLLPAEYFGPIPGAE